MRFGNSLKEHLGETEEVIFTPYRINPVYSQVSASVLFLENKNVHIIQYEKGVKTEVTRK